MAVISCKIYSFENYCEALRTRLQFFQKQRKKQGDSFNNLMAEIYAEIDLITDADSANSFVKRIDKFKHIKTSKLLASKGVKIKAKALNLVYNKETSLYEVAKPKEDASL